MSPEPPSGENAETLRLARGLARLLSEVEELPLRYAPFFDRLSALWDLSEAGVRSVLEQAANERAWRRTPLPGMRRLQVRGGPRVERGESALMRYAPGLRFPAHRHAGSETVLVLEGSYADSHGHCFGPGEQQTMEAGSQHSLRVSRDGPCVAAIVTRGFEFTGLPLRFLQKLVMGKTPR